MSRSRMRGALGSPRTRPKCLSVACSTMSRSLAASSVAKETTALTNQGWFERGTGSVRYHPERARSLIRFSSTAASAAHSVSRGNPNRALSRFPPSPIRITGIPPHGRRLTQNAQCKTLLLHYRCEGAFSQMIFYPEERLAIFIDGANLYSAARGLAFDIDYRRLLELFSTKGRLIRAFYYTALVEDQEYSPIRPLVDWLDYNGYAMVTKPTKEFTDAMGRRRIKGNMDIELAIDMLEMAEHIDHAILFSGDGDFRRLVEAVQRRGVRVSVVSTIRSSPPMVSDDLRRQADNFMELQELGPSIMRNHVPRDELQRVRGEPVEPV